MKSENGTLIAFIRNQIRDHGPQSFAWFMQQALYHPEHGYYASGRCVIGRRGDYFTNVSVGPLFGQLLAAQFVEVWERLGKPDGFFIVEQGAHDGQFARDVLEFLQKRFPEFFAALRYRVVEPFFVLQERQRQMLKAFGDKIEWRDSLQPFIGVHFSNELLDAMPVRLISDGRERLVGLAGDKFVFLERPQGITASEQSSDNSAFNQQTLDWIDAVAANVRRGYVIAIDYGRSNAGLQRHVQVRAGHRHLDSPFEKIGEADITMHVNWSSIIRHAEASGMRVAGFTDQHHFLTGILSGFDCDGCAQSLSPVSAKATRELHTLLHPEMLGRAFQVLALAKNVSTEGPPLTGFKFAREPCPVPELHDSVQ